MPLNDPSHDQRSADLFRAAMGLDQLEEAAKSGKVFPGLPLQQVPAEPPPPSIETHILCTCGCAIRHENQPEVRCQKCGILWLWDVDIEVWYMGTPDPTPEQLAELNRRAAQIIREDKRCGRQL